MLAYVSIVTRPKHADNAASEPAPAQREWCGATMRYNLKEPTRCAVERRCGHGTEGA